MSSEIEFGQVEHSTPDRGLRPDTDKHFAVVPCADVNENDLPIFVDMDVMRDMEAHARENTRVELGGVMLGRQHVDENGDPFVLITDSLRAKHYEATKGSFKFTHETWNQITRERNEFKNDLELVGWYHTHPGWGVFLSGMDLFICNNFFSRPLDVALVIDPCAGDRGWFQWATRDKKTRQTSGFYLMTNRHRRSELNYFAEIFSSANPTIHDPRFRQASFADHSIEQGDSMVNLIDNRRPVFELAVVSMLFLQLLVVGLLGWRLTSSSATESASESEQRLAVLESQLQTDNARRDASIREGAYSKILNTIVEKETGEPGLAEQFAEVARQNQLLSENLEGQISRIKLAANENKELAYSLTGEQLKTEQLKQKLKLAQQTLSDYKEQNQELKQQVSLDPAADAESLQAVFPPWLLYTMGGLGLFVLGLIGGSIVTRVVKQDDDLITESPTSKPQDVPDDLEMSVVKSNNESEVATDPSAVG